jgi:hypothetical protein
MDGVDCKHYNNEIIHLNETKPHNKPPQLDDG